MTIDSREKAIIDFLDQSPAPPETRMSIAYELVKTARLNDPLIGEILSEYERKFPSSEVISKLVNSIRENRFASSDDVHRDAIDIAAAIIPSDNLLDGYFAEFFFYWARNLGVANENIIGIFQNNLELR